MHRLINEAMVGADLGYQACQGCVGAEEECGTDHCDDAGAKGVCSDPLARFG